MVSHVKQVFAIALLVLAAGCEYIPFSWGELEGKQSSPLANWREVADVSIVQLETLREGKPYSVNLWIANIEGTLHVFAGDNVAAWVENIQTDPNVRLGVNGSIYELTAAQETDATQFEKFAQEWEAKYGNRPRNENVDETYLYRLTARE